MPTKTETRKAAAAGDADAICELVRNSTTVRRGPGALIETVGRFHALPDCVRPRVADVFRGKRVLITTRDDGYAQQHRGRVIAVPYETGKPGGVVLAIDGQNRREVYVNLATIATIIEVER